MGENKNSDAHDSTLPAPAKKTGYGSTVAAGIADAATVASKVPSPTDPGNSATLPAGSSTTAANDYPQLIAIDPQHYVVGMEIARGGMGRILAARDRRLGRPVAIKELLIKSDDLRARFEREARITAKLQHPSIVSILEAGVKSSGEPFYVMKLVTGQSLDKAVADRPELESRLGLLPNVIAVVDALAYAHDHHVIHRDLKPHNVLVGEFGETVVIDWGLAKDLKDTGAPEIVVGPYRPEASALGKTVAGAVMGTPGYMPAEQARGDTVDERADVYSLGAMLYHVLVGAPPYVGKTADEILDKVIAGPPPPIAERVAEIVPLDLVTIVNKAMARSAADRYSTAKQLAEDLKKFQTGQLVGAHRYSTWQLVRRWIRRHRAAVSIAGIALLVLAVTGTLSIQRIVRAQHLAEQRREQADEQRQVAQASRADAEDVLRFMLYDLGDKLAPLGRLDLLDDVAKKAVAHYDRKETNLSDTDLTNRAVALRNLGEVLTAQGHGDDALREYRAALAIDQALANKAPGDDSRQRNLSLSYRAVAYTLMRNGDLDGASPNYRAAVAIDEMLASKAPTDRGRQRDLAVSHSDIGDLLRQQGDRAGALVEYRIALAIDATLAARAPNDLEAQDGLAFDHQGIGEILSEQGDVAGALSEWRATLTIRARRAEEAPGDAEAQRALLIAHTKVGEGLLANGDPSAALAEFRASLTIAEPQAANDPTNADRQMDLEIGHSKIGDAQLALGDAASALSHYRTALTIAERLAKEDPAAAVRRYELAETDERVGDAFAAQHDEASARATYEAGLALAKRLVRDDPKDADFVREVSDIEGKLTHCCHIPADRAH